MLFIELFVIFVMVVIIVMFIQRQRGEVEYFKSSVDERYYLVRKLPDMKDAADYLADINKKLVKLVRHMVAKYPDNDDVLQLYKNYKPDSISEGSADTGYTSYSINKGEKIILCIRQKDKTFVDKNIVMYVAIHEIAHVMTKDVGHTKSFWSNFKFLLEEAININVYNRQDFNNIPQEYCGIEINNSVV